jgi:serine/threonine protein kinase
MGSVTSSAVEHSPKMATHGGGGAVNSADEDVTTVLDPLLLRARGRIGSTLRGKWRLDALLGVGGMAAVYAGTHRNGMRAAVKVLHTEMMINSEVRARFLREGYVANSIDHESAVRVLDDDVAEDGSLFLVTELLDGETLEDRRLRLGGRMPEEEVLSAIDQLLDMLVIAHERGVVHRDLKPENLFLTRTGQLKVLDFGIAFLRSLSTTSTATKQGTSMGTAAFMSPEQARGLWAEVDSKSDLWATGATMFCLLTGSLVHGGRTTNEVLLNAMTTTAPSIASVAPDVSPAVAIVVDRALAFSRDQRWRDAQRMQDAVRRAYHDRRGSPITTAPRLIVPESVANRTLSGSAIVDGVARLLTTAGPVANTAQTRIPAMSRRTLALAGAVATGVIVVATVTWLIASARQHRAPQTVSVAVSAPPAVSAPAISRSEPRLDPGLPAVRPPELVMESAPTSSVPELAVTDLPIFKPPVVPVAAKAVAIGSASAAKLPDPAPAAPSVSAATKPDCEPPYVVDPQNGHMHWKAECFEQK